MLALGGVALAAAVFVAVLLLRGEDEPETFTRASVEETMTGAIRDQLPAETTMDQLECVEDGDELHWRCLTTALQGGQRYRLSVAITCDRETGRCLSEPATLAPLP